MSEGEGQQPATPREPDTTLGFIYGFASGVVFCVGLGGMAVAANPGLDVPIQSWLILAFISVGAFFAGLRAIGLACLRWYDYAE